VGTLFLLRHAEPAYFLPHTHFLFDDGFSARTFGSFTTLAYLLPLLAGFVADRYIGARQAVVFGAVLLVIGHMLMTIEGRRRGRF